MKAHYRRYIYKELDLLISQAYDQNKEIKYIGLDSEELQLLQNEVDAYCVGIGSRIYMDTENDKQYKGLKEAITVGKWPFKYKDIPIYFEEN